MVLLPETERLDRRPRRREPRRQRGRPDADLGQAGHVVGLGRAAHRVAVAVPDAVAFVHEVEMRVDLQKMESAARVFRPAKSGKVGCQVPIHSSFLGKFLIF